MSPQSMLSLSYSCDLKIHFLKHLGNIDTSWNVPTQTWMRAMAFQARECGSGHGEIVNLGPELVRAGLLE